MISVLNNLKDSIKENIPDPLKDTAFVRFFGLTQVPLIWFLKPKVINLDNEGCCVEIPLTRKSKNHLGSLYFGALCAGADIAGGLIAMKLIKESGVNIALSFKDFKAEFLKRAEGNTHFINTQGTEIKNFVEEVIASKERMNMPVKIQAFVPDKDKDEVVAQFELTLSLKVKG